MKKIGIIILLLILAIAVYYFTRPDTFKVERSIEINASADQIWDEVSKFKNWEGWSPWKEKDNTVKTIVEGEDGTVGAVSTYTSEKSGSGKMTNTGIIKNKEITYKMHFLEPWESYSDGYINLEKIDENITKVTWGFTGENKGFARFMNMDKMIGGDFKRGMVLLKEKVESLQ